MKVTITDEERQALDDAHAGITALVKSTGNQGSRATEWACVFRAPSRLEWKRFVQTREKDVHSAVEAIFRSTCIFPPKATLEELLDQPGCAGIPFACVDAIAALTGVEGTTALAK
jgi:hypothetical protein